MRINTQFGWYLCLMYFELVLSLFSVVMIGIVVAAIMQVNESHKEAQTLSLRTLLLNSPMFVACIIAIFAKSNLNTLIQYRAFLLFVISTIINIGFSVMAGVSTGGISFSVVSLAR